MTNSNRTALFSLIRQMLGRGFTQSEVEAIDARLDAMEDIGSLDPPDQRSIRPRPDAGNLPTMFANSNAVKISEADIARAARTLRVSPQHIRAIIKVESGGRGFDRKGRPIILFEPHIFHRRTAGRWSPSSYSYRRWRTKPYPRTMDKRWEQMAAAAAKNFDAALESASVGLFQIMGFHWKALGYSSVREFYRSMAASEAGHLDAVVRFISANGLAPHLRKCRKGNPDSCRDFVRRYNGAGYARNNYHVKFARAL